MLQATLVLWKFLMRMNSLHSQVSIPINGFNSFFNTYNIFGRMIEFVGLTGYMLLNQRHKVSHELKELTSHEIFMYVENRRE